MLRTPVKQLESADKSNEVAPKHLCGKCPRNVVTGIQCDRCQVWWHWNCSGQENREGSNDWEELDFICQKCGYSASLKGKNKSLESGENSLSCTQRNGQENPVNSECQTCGKLNVEVVNLLKWKSEMEEWVKSQVNLQKKFEKEIKDIMAAENQELKRKLDDIQNGNLVEKESWKTEREKMEKENVHVVSKLKDCEKKLNAAEEKFEGINNAQLKVETLTVEIDKISEMISERKSEEKKLKAELRKSVEGCNESLEETIKNFRTEVDQMITNQIENSNSNPVNMTRSGNTQIQEQQSIPWNPKVLIIGDSNIKRVREHVTKAVIKDNRVVIQALSGKNASVLVAKTIEWVESEPNCDRLVIFNGGLNNLLNERDPEEPARAVAELADRIKGHPRVHLLVSSIPEVPRVERLAVIANRKIRIVLKGKRLPYLNLEDIAHRPGRVERDGIHPK